MDLIEGLQTVTYNGISFKVVKAPAGFTLRMLSATQSGVDDSRAVADITKIDNDKLQIKAKCNCNYFEMVNKAIYGQHYGCEQSETHDWAPKSHGYLAFWQANDGSCGYDQEENYYLKKSDVQFCCAPYAVRIHNGQRINVRSSSCGNKDGIKNSQTCAFRLGNGTWCLAVTAAGQICLPDDIAGLAALCGAQEAILLDSGGSSQLVYDGAAIVRTGRLIPNVLALVAPTPVAPTPSTPTTGNTLPMKGIDVSMWQGAIDWNQVKKSGRTFAIIKAGGADAGYYKDSTFERNYAGAVAAGLHVGAFYFCSKNDFNTEAEAIKQAEKFLSYIAGKKFDFPIYADIEGTKTSLGKYNITTAAIAFCRRLEQAGYYAGIYGSDISTFEAILDDSRLSAFDHWVAKYSTAKPSYVKSYGIWQYGGTDNYLESHSVPGVSSAACDQDYAYKDYPTIIQSAGLNGYSKTTPVTPVTPDPTPEPTQPTAAKSVTDLAFEVISGSWGTGTARREALTVAGYDYAAVQEKVDAILHYQKITTVAKEVLAGRWGNGWWRKWKLIRAGYSYTEVQQAVNQVLAGTR